MSSNKRPRKAYRPRPVMNPLAFLRPASASERITIEARFCSALEAMVAGSHPGPEEWRDLSDAVNTVETMATGTGHLDPAEVMPVVQAAIEGMVGASQRYRAGKGMRLDAAGIAALRRVIVIYAECMERLTEAEVWAAQKLTGQRVALAQRQVGVPGVEVVSC
jgi:hypothetical protein